MAANTSPIFPNVINSPGAIVAAANTARDGSGVLVTIFTAGVNGNRIDFIKWTSAQLAAAANSLMVVRIWVTDAAGSNPSLIAEAVIVAATASNTVIGAFGVFDFVNGIYTNGVGAVVSIGITGGLAVNPGYIVKVTQSVFAGVQDRMSVYPKAGDY